MEVISGRTMRSGLNPDAAPYVPAALRAVEDFSPEWWALVQSTPWFAAYWMRERFHEFDLDDDVCEDDDVDLPDDISDAFFSFPVDVPPQEEGRKRETAGEVISWGADKYWKAAAGQSCGAERAKYAEKAARMVSVKMIPRTIHQPR